MSKIKLLTESQITQVFERFRLNNPEPKTELIAPNPYCLLVSVVLSAQATDKSVNAACAPLYEKVRTPEQMLELGEEKLISYIKSIGLYRAKARHVMGLSKRLVQDFNSTLPSTREELESLPGSSHKAGLRALCRWNLKGPW